MKSGELRCGEKHRAIPDGIQDWGKLPFLRVKQQEEF